MARTNHEKGYWKSFFNSFSYGLSCQYKKSLKKIFWKYHAKGTIKRSKFRISIENDGEIIQGFLYFSPKFTEKEAWLRWLEKNVPSTYKTIRWIIKKQIVTLPEIERQFPKVQTYILTLFGNHDFIISRHWIGSGKPIIFTDSNVLKEVLKKYREEVLPKLIYGKKVQEVKEGYKYQGSVFDIIKKRMIQDNYQLMIMEQDKYMAIDGHKVKFDIFGVARTPAFNTPMFFAGEVKNYAITYKHLSHLLLFNYKVKKVFGEQPVNKFFICRGAYPVEMFKRAYELGINIMTTNTNSENHLKIYPKMIGLVA